MPLSSFVGSPVIGLSPGWHLGGLYTLALLGAGIVVLVGAAALSRERTVSVSVSVVYVALGALAAVVMSWLDVRPLDPVGNHRLLERLAELALIVAVFSAGLTIERTVRRKSWISIGVLLSVVMPLTIVAIAAFGAWAMGLSLGAAVLLGAVLAPTDPVLAGDVGLTGPGGEVLGEPRLSLHTEAGFNDGLASPFVVLGLLVATRGGIGWIGSWLVADLLYAAGFALALGLAVGHVAAWGVARARAGTVLSEQAEGPAVLGLMLAVYGLTEALGAYGLLAVFAAGFAFRRYEFDHRVHRAAHHTAEAAGRTLELVVLLMLGTMLTTDGLAAPGVAGWLLAPLLILVIRPLLVMTLVGRGLMDRQARLFLGFFGVRGVAALFYAALVADSHALRPAETKVVVWTTITCVVVSIVVHGLTATPLTRRWLGA